MRGLLLYRAIGMRLVTGAQQALVPLFFDYADGKVTGDFVGGLSRFCYREFYGRFQGSVWLRSACHFGW